MYRRRRSSMRRATICLLFVIAGSGCSASRTVDPGDLAVSDLAHTPYDDLGIAPDDLAGGPGGDLASPPDLATTMPGPDRTITLFDGASFYFDGDPAKNHRENFATVDFPADGL